MYSHHACTDYHHFWPAVILIQFVRQRGQNPNSLPGALVVLAAKSGSDWIPLGPTSAKAGRKVATVFEDPR